jgi:hypothetical protein
MARFDAPIIKARITPDMIGKDCLLFTRPVHYLQMPAGEEFNAEISEVKDAMRRSYSQLGLYWSCCSLVAENVEDNDWNTQKKVDEQCKITARHVDFWVHYHNRKTGQQELHIKTKSISFDELANLEACGYFDEAFRTMAEKIGISVDELIDQAKSKMHGRGQ